MSHLSIVNTVIFAAIAFFHVLRLVYQSPVTIGQFDVPLWASMLAVVGAVLLAILNAKTIRKSAL